ncbi:NADH-quinone oxidoreductase subunit NuoG [Francisella tularensis]|uniref:NADH-quinone oxidoreductase subunit NuoG n=1 Tax=Francisella tularensis TaxID=263 RepID=UPI0000E26D0C|nr:NADH-quinone oxidoreductase subunit NuoG [Francisella tularensis]ABI83527.1 NADH dehydrogenase (ubiquinone) [Francisella tularensis subsp. holarctica OSU18]AJI51655.1 NADH dehydrogenase (quinone), G subunit [Francisella tularensis subsp. holarctica]AJI65120.1 NADH dehydrogenase (quinone), G subunit [Francisella tularensis subsp. holarctica]AZP06753.1 NADH-quinone oxidoreductase subunit G [Francisella tularensis]AZP10303.1 NADH-quinone oxidoreductase subunit G [Francisella tularensis]
MSDNKESKKISIEIDGKDYQALPNQSIIEVADANGIYIPRFCYHKKLSVAANCRMCLVDVEGARRASPACATPVMDGMKVKTRSEKALQMQKDVMEFLLINHPLDCPICDQGGECELQDIAMGYGNTTSEYLESKRTVEDPELGPLVATDMTRCILCTRCVRFGEEIAGVKELGVMGRGDHSAISTYISGEMVDSEISANIIDLCPVGALTSKPFRFKARSWELKQFPTLSSGDALATEINAHIYQNKLVRVVPRENDITGTWIADRDRFEYTGLYSQDRIQQPMIKKAGDWVDVSWEEALDFVKVAIQKTIEKDGSDAISAIVSETATSEEMYLTKKLLAAVGSVNIDARVRQYADIPGISAGKGLSCSLEDIRESDFILVFGSNIRKEYPLVNIAIKDAVEKNAAKAVAWNVCDYNFNYDIKQVRLAADNIQYIALSLLKAIFVRANLPYGDLDEILRKVDPAAEVRDVADRIVAAKAPKIIIGQDIVNTSGFETVFSILDVLEKVTSVRGGVLATNVNSVAADRIFSSSKSKFSTYKCLNGQTNTKLLLTVHTELAKDSLYGEQKLRNALENIDIVVSFTAFADKFTKDTADIILPIATHYETSGSFVDLFGNRKEFKQVVKPYAGNKELWRVLRVLGNLLELEGFDYNSIAEVTNDAYATRARVGVNHVTQILNANLDYQKEVAFVASNSMYSTTSLLRRAEPLQKTTDAKRFAGVRISQELADEIGLKGQLGVIKIYNIDNEINPEVVVDPSLQAKNIMLPRALFKDFLSSDNISIKLVEEER